MAKRKVISAKSADKLGSKVRRKSAEKPAPSPAEEKETRQHASMAASMAHSAASQEATQTLIAKNTEVVREFAQEVRDMAASRAAPAVAEGPAEYVHPFADGATFDIKRGKDKLLKRIYMRPGILEERDEL